MKIEKYIKKNGNKYKVITKENEYTLYDDIIIKYNLLAKSEISDKDFNEILKENDLKSSYYDALKFINRRLRSEKEVHDYLKKKGLSEIEENNIIKSLKESNYLNNKRFLESYLKDQIALTNNGPKRIIKDLEKHGFTEEEVSSNLAKIDSIIWNQKITNYIEKKIHHNHDSSSYMLKAKLLLNLKNMGFDAEEINDVLNKYEINDKDAYVKEYAKAKKILGKKYTGKELEQKIRERLYRKGFKQGVLNEE